MSIRLVLAVSLGALCACDVTTQQVRRTFPVEVRVSLPATPLESGWTVSDVSGELPLTSLRFFEGRVLVAEWSPLSLLISTAHAHPGHYVPGESLAEVLSPTTVDLAKREPLSWDVAQAVTGSYGSAQLELGGARISGVASRSDQTLRFDTGSFTPRGAITAIRFEHELATDPGRMVLSIDLGVLLSRIEFDKALAAPSAEGVTRFDRASPAFNGFERGVTDTSSYRFTWQPD